MNRGTNTLLLKRVVPSLLIMALNLSLVISADFFCPSNIVRAAEFKTGGNHSAVLVKKTATYAEAIGRADYTAKSAVLTKEYLLNGTPQAKTVSISGFGPTTSDTQTRTVSAGSITLTIPASTQNDTPLCDLNGYSSSRVYEIAPEDVPTLHADETTVSGYAFEIAEGADSARWSLTGEGSETKVSYEAAGTETYGRLKELPANSLGAAVTIDGLTFYTLSSSKLVYSNKISAPNGNTSLTYSNAASAVGNTSAAPYQVLNKYYSVGNGVMLSKSEADSLGTAVLRTLGSNCGGCFWTNTSYSETISDHYIVHPEGYTMIGKETGYYYVVPAYTISEKTGPNGIFTYQDSYTSPEITYRGSKAVTHEVRLNYIDAPSYIIRPQSTEISNRVSSTMSPYDAGHSDAFVAINTEKNKLSVNIAGKQLTNVAGGVTYTLNYENANTESEPNCEKYISALVYEATDMETPLYYGRLEKVESNSGTVKITMPEALTVETDYVLAIFEESSSDTEHGTYTMGEPAIASFTAMEAYYVTGLSATASLSEANSGELITDREIIAKATMSSGELIIVDEIYVLPTQVWNSLPDATQKSERKLKGVPGVNSIIIPSESELNGSMTYPLTVVYFDSSEKNGSGGDGVNCGASTRFTTAVDIVLASAVENVYTSCTKNGVTWYYQKELSDDGRETGYIVNVHTTSTDIHSYIDSNAILNIPDEIDGYRVKSIGSGVKTRPFIPADANGFVQISFPKSLEAINSYAFYANSACMRLNLPSTVSKIGSFGFYDCDRLSCLSIHSASIGAGAFGNCDSLIQLEIDGDGSIGRVAFAECRNLKKVTISGCNNIGQSAFANDTSIDSLNLSRLRDSCINSYSFDHCSALTSLSIPASNSVKEYAFQNCYKLSHLMLDIARVENQSFKGCASIQFLVFGKNVGTVEYDWGGYSNSLYESDDSGSESLKTSIYIQNPDTLFECYHSGTDIYSSFMSHSTKNGGYKFRRTIDAYVASRETAENEPDRSSAVISASLPYYLTAKDEIAKGGLTWWDYLTAGSMLSVTVHEDETIENAAMPEAKRDGIMAYYDGKIFDNAAADKSKIIVKPLYSDASATDKVIANFYYFDKEEADRAISEWITKNNFPYGLAEVYNNKEDFLKATEGIRDNPAISPASDRLPSYILRLTVLYYPADDPAADTDYTPGETGDLTYYMTDFDAAVVHYSDEQDFLDQGLTYASAVQKIKELNEKLNASDEQMQSLDKILQVLNKIGVGASLSEEEINLLSSSSSYPNLRGLVRQGAGNTQSPANSDAYVSGLNLQIQSMQKELNSKNGIVADARTLLNVTADSDISAAIKSLQTNIKDSSAKIERVTADLSAAQKENQTLTDKNKSLKNENTVLVSENKSLKAEKKTLKAEQTDLSSQKKTLSDENKKLSDENKNLSSGNQALTSKNRTLTSENQALISENQTLSSEYQSLASENQVLVSENRTLASENQALASENQTLASEYQSLISENNILSSDNQNLTAENIRLLSEIDAMSGSSDFSNTGTANTGATSVSSAQDFTSASGEDNSSSDTSSGGTAAQKEKNNRTRRLIPIAVIAATAAGMIIVRKRFV